MYTFDEMHKKIRDVAEKGIQREEKYKVLNDGILYGFGAGIVISLILMRIFNGNK